MIAESGSNRPGAMSRSAAYASRAYQSERTIASWRRVAHRVWMPDVRRHGSSRGAAAGRGPDRLELLRRPFRLAGVGELAGQHLAQRDEQLDVQRGVGEPVPGQRPGRPVGRRMALLQTHIELLLDHRAERDPLVAEQPAGQFGVEQPGRAQAELGQARQILGGGVQDPLGVVDGVGRAARSRRADGNGSMSTVPTPARRSWTR